MQERVGVELGGEKPDASVYHIRPQLVHCCHIRCMHGGVLQQS